MAVLDRFLETINLHPYRTAISVLLMAAFLGLLFPVLLPYTLPAVFAPATVWLQATLWTVGSGWGVFLANLEAVLAGVIFAYYIPKLVGNVLQFVGKRLIEGIIGAFSTIPYLIARTIGDWLEPYLPESEDETPYEFDEDFGRNFLVIPGRFIKNIFLGMAWLIAQIGKGVNTVGQIMSGEYHLDHYDIVAPKLNSKSNREPDYTSLDDEAPASKVEDNKPATCWTSSTAFLKRHVVDVVVDVYTNPNDALKTSDADPAILFPETGKYFSSLWSKGMNFLGETIPLKTYDTMREAEERGNFKWLEL